MVCVGGMTGDGGWCVCGGDREMGSGVWGITGRWVVVCGDDGEMGGGVWGITGRWVVVCGDDGEMGSGVWG